MKTAFVTSHVEDNGTMRDSFEERASRLEKHVKRFKDDLVFLHGAVDKNPHKHEFYATLSLYLPSVTLHCRERGGDFTSALNSAFLDIARQIEKYKDKINREKRRKSR